MNAALDIARDLREKIEAQRDEIIRQQKALTDSIRYAGNLQKALYPKPELVKNLLPNSFLLFKPRDYVSGDFYWISKHEKKIVIAAGDCTGHGVPGAFMSILGITYLDQITIKENLPSPNRILNILREMVMKAMHQTGEDLEQRDGMDLALYVIDYEKGMLEYAGANNPLYIVRNKKIIEIKADRMPIGINACEEKSFTNNTMELEENDVIYAFTDGYADQFGGPEGKKFKYNNLRKQLLDIQHLSMAKQRDHLWKTFIKWKGSLDQIDDILIIGVKYNSTIN